MFHPEASNVSSGDSESDFIIVCDQRSSVTRRDREAAAPTPSLSSSFVGYYPLETARTTATAATASSATTTAAAAATSAAAAAAAAAAVAVYGCTTTILSNNDDSSAPDQETFVEGTSRRDSVKTVVVDRMGLAIGGGLGTERGGGGGGGDGDGVGGGDGDGGGGSGCSGGDGSIVAGARDLLAAAASSSRKEEEETPMEKKKQMPRPPPGVVKRSCDLCSKRKRKCSGQKPCSVCVIIEGRDPNHVCVYSPRRKSRRKRVREKAHTDVVPCEGSVSDRRTDCQTVDTAAEIMVQIKAEIGGPAANQHDVANEYEEGSRRPLAAAAAAAASNGGLSPSRDPKVQFQAEDGEPAAEPVAAEHYVAASLDEATRRLRRVQQALSTGIIELRKRREEDYKRLRSELYNEEARDDRDAYFINYLEIQLKDARRALSAPIDLRPPLPAFTTHWA